ncbi:hypothetical protein [Absiella sp. AM29-15]|uniref:hypothetical protein n=1 Tax=Absiella sp. AM29-15 TaxID=2292278 RepID=UPI000E429999|nr:hypothetical protein [Absiella sp. AM29-15]RGC51799.1 hypothetical protein DW761_08970 [Absiella sp. AM29-15]
MEEKVLFKSKGLNNSVKLRYRFSSIMSVVLVIFLGILRNTKRTNLFGRVGYALTSSEREGLLYMMIFFLVLSCLLFIMTNHLRKCEIKIFEDYIDIKTTTYLMAMLSKSYISNKIIKISDIKGVTSVTKYGYVLIDAHGEKSKVFCKDCDKVEEILYKKIKKEMDDDKATK